MRILALGTLLLMSSGAFAYPMTFVFSGYINQSDVSQMDIYGAPPDLGISVGTSFNGVLNYDPDPLQCFATNESHRVCGAAEANLFWMVSFGSFVLTSTSPRVTVTDDSVLFNGGSNLFLPPVFDGWTPLAQLDTYLRLFDTPSTASLLSSPGAPPDLTQFQQGTWTENAFIRPITQHFDGLRWNVGGTITSFHAVPEPGTFALFGVALLAMAVLRRRSASSRVIDVAERAERTA